VGTPLALANRDGSVVQYMRYDSFGNLIEVRGNVVPLPLGFAGGLFDPDTGLTRFVWRDYDADTGRFTALDPLGEKGGDKDWYGYCVDDPVNRLDAWGLFMNDTPGQRIAKAGLKGGLQGAFAGFNLGKGFGVGVPGAAAGVFVGSGYEMAKQAIEEYPPVKEKLEDWKEKVEQQMKDSWEMSGSGESGSDGSWPSLYYAPPD
jgi:RHS repeat-associated protein